MIHSEAYIALRHDFFRVCVFITFNAALANVLPAASRLREKPRLRCAYEVFVDLVAGFGLNWRTQLPSLDAEFIGFKRTIRHTYRNWKQAHADKAYLDGGD